MRIERCGNVFILVVLLLSSIDARAGSLLPMSVNGGVLSQPVASGNYLYVASGQSITIWDLTDAGQPARIGDTSATLSKGPLRDLAVSGNKLYAVWNRNDGTGGLSIFSLDDPAHPAQLGEIDDYAIGALTQKPSAIVAAGGMLYLADDVNGLFTFDATDPVHPTVVSSDASVAVPFHHLRSVGDRLIAVADRNNAVPCAYLFDVTDPAAPQPTGSVCFDPAVITSINATHDTVIGIGSQLQVFDTSNASSANASAQYVTDIAAADNLLINGDAALVFGGQDLQVWDFTDPLTPILSSTLPINTFATDEVALLPFGIVALTHSDLGVVLTSDDAFAPSLLASLPLPDVEARAGTASADVAFFAQRSYGFDIEARDSPWSLTQYEPALPFDSSMRDFEDIASSSGRVFLAAQGSGLIVADVTDPLNPAELGRIDLPGTHAIATDGKLAYAAISGDSPVLSVISVEDPANIQLRGSLGLANVYQMQLRGNTLFVAAGIDGLNVVDTTNIWEPVIVAVDSGCDARAIDISADLTKAFIACEDASLRILDVTDPMSPALLSTFSLSDASVNHASAVLASGNKVYLGHAFGIEEIAIADIANPVVVRRYEAGSPIRNFTRVGAGNIIAFSTEAGVFRFLEDSIFDDSFDLGAEETPDPL